MSDLEIKVMELIKEGKNNREICNLLEIDLMALKDILLSLKTKGVLYNKKCRLDGTILYLPNQDLLGNNVSGIDIVMAANKLKAILISDLHLGTKEERLDLLNLVYDYATKEGIHLIINGGDLINGLTKERHNVVKTMWEQCEYFIKRHPFDKNIVNICVLGNHDIKSLLSNNINFKVLLENERPDFLAAGVGKGKINLKEDSISLYHPLSCQEKARYAEKLVLVGHSHHYKIKVVNENIVVYVPALSNYVPAGKGIIPSFLVMETTLEGGYLRKIKLENLTFNAEKLNYLGVQELEVKRVLRRG